MTTFAFLTPEQAALFDREVRGIVREELMAELERMRRLLEAAGGDGDQAELVARDLKGKRRRG